ncbi:MAG: hypothetical protein R3C58_05680 [Parvularculaceae bacterium]
MPVSQRKYHPSQPRSYDNGAHACEPSSASNGRYDAANEAKANFDDDYNAPDPRAYYMTLGALDYQIPTNAKPVFQKVIAAMKRPRAPKIVDVGCSYGVNAAMLRLDTTFEEMMQRYTQPGVMDQSSAQTIIQDAADFASGAGDDPAAFIGLDVAGEAAGYADAVGLIDEAVVANLEEAPPDAEAAAAMAGAGLIITTGAVGYVGAETFAHIVEAAETPPWVAAFVLRQFPFEDIAGRLRDYGLVTEKLQGETFLQRRFRDEEEQEGAIAALHSAGRDPQGFETDGYYHAEFYLARPAGEISGRIGELGLI